MFSNSFFWSFLETVAQRLVSEEDIYKVRQASALHGVSLHRLPPDQGRRIAEAIQAELVSVIDEAVRNDEGSLDWRTRLETLDIELTTFLASSSRPG